jgi:integrase
LRKYVLDDLGGVRMGEIRRADIQALIDRLRGRGLSEGTVRNVITAVRVLFRHALERGYVEANPTLGFQLGSGNRRTRAATPAEAAELLAVLPDTIRGIYTVAAYAGLRRGELRAIRWDDIDLAARVITVRTAWDDIEGPVKPKSAASTDREVPIIGVLHDYLTNLKATSRRDGQDFVFGFTAERVFEPSTVRMRAAKAWEEANVVRAEWGKPPLVPIGLHELRHSYVSMMHAAGVPLERIGDYCGHSTVHMTNQYRHLLKGHGDDSTTKMDAYLARADSRGRIEQLESGETLNG